MTDFIPVDTSKMKWLLQERRESVILVSNHGLGDNVFLSSSFEHMREHFGTMFFASTVNAYARIFHESKLVSPIYAGGVNCHSMNLHTSDEWADHLDYLDVDAGVKEAFVYCVWMHNPDDMTENSFTKGRKFMSDYFGYDLGPRDLPIYRVAPDSISKEFVDAFLNRWLGGMGLICICRYGHTDPEKNLGHSSVDIISIIDQINKEFPKRYKYISLDYVPNSCSPEGSERDVLSVYGNFPCDSATLWWILKRAAMLITIPSGPMVVGATIPSLKMVTVWKHNNLFHFLDPQHGKVVAIPQSDKNCSVEFMQKWLPDERDAVLSRWDIRRTETDGVSVGKVAVDVLNGK